MVDKSDKNSYNINKKEMVKVLRNTGIGLSRIYGSNIRIQIDVNNKFADAKLKITEILK